MEFAMPIPIRDDFDAVALRPGGEEVEGRGSGAPPFDAGCHLRGIDMLGGGQDRRHDAWDVRDGSESIAAPDLKDKAANHVLSRPRQVNGLRASCKPLGQRGEHGRP
jgi:hypothetical protein